jgi:hypothetical protein
MSLTGYHHMGHEERDQQAPEAASDEFDEDTIYTNGTMLILKCDNDY